MQTQDIHSMFSAVTVYSLWHVISRCWRYARYYPVLKQTSSHCVCSSPRVYVQIIKTFILCILKCITGVRASVGSFVDIVLGKEEWHRTHSKVQLCTMGLPLFSSKSCVDSRLLAHLYWFLPYLAVCLVNCAHMTSANCCLYLLDFRNCRARC